MARGFLSKRFIDCPVNARFLELCQKDSIKVQRPDDALRLQNDALIAYTISQKSNYFLVTDNVKDFSRLQRVINFDFIKT